MARKPHKVRKKVHIPRSHVYVGAGPSLLGLPAEVRNMIYRLLLVADKPLGNEAGNEFGFSRPQWAKFREYHLQPAILRTCRQVHQEARPILFGENTIGIQIYATTAQDEFDSDSSDSFSSGDSSSDEDEMEPKTLFMNFELKRGPSYSQDHIPSIKKFQRIEIVIDTVYLELEDVGYDVRFLCSTLCKMPMLHYMSLHLLKECRRNSNKSNKNNHTILGPFGTLRNMRSVAIHGVPQPFAQRLKGLMLGNTPQADGKEMYRLLEKYVKGPKGSLSDLQKASVAVKELDFQKFKEIRSKILSDGQRAIEAAVQHISDCDPKSEDHQAPTKGNYATIYPGFLQSPIQDHRTYY